MENYQLVVRTTLLFLMLSGKRSSTNIYAPKLSESNLTSYHPSSIKTIFLFTKILFTKIDQLCFLTYRIPFESKGHRTPVQSSDQRGTLENTNDDSEFRPVTSLTNLACPIGRVTHGTIRWQVVYAHARACHEQVCKHSPPRDLSNRKQVDSRDRGSVTCSTSPIDPL